MGVWDGLLLEGGVAVGGTENMIPTADHVTQSGGFGEREEEWQKQRHTRNALPGRERERKTRT